MTIAPKETAADALRAPARTTSDMVESRIQEPIYQARIPIFPRSVKGKFRSIKWTVLTVAYGVYFLLPWLRWERLSGPSQAVLFDIQARRFYVFDLVIHPQQIFWLAGFLVIAALLLFFVTGIAGRVFCGYFCFQTLWTDVYILIERMVQGERPARIRLAKSPWSGEKFWKLGATHLLWLTVAFATGLTFTLYWGDAPQLALDIFTGNAPFPAYATTLFLTATTYVMAGLAREQVCTYMCPYARFQSAMFDRDTLIVAYDRARGEAGAGRAKLAKGRKTQAQRQAQGFGDCIDCGYCVQVCPVGIDIRNGLQYQCISCALCIDACNTIMDSMNWPRGLIGYDSQRHQETGHRTRILKPKTFGYGAILMLAATALVWNILSTAKLNVSAHQVRQPLFVVLSDGRIQNSYELKLNNLTQSALPVRVHLEHLPGAELDMGNLDNLVLEPEQRLRLRVRVRMPRRQDVEQIPFEFVVTAPEDSSVAEQEEPAYFSMPRR